jgi:hypothetical protein
MIKKEENTDQYLYWSANNGTTHNRLLTAKTKSSAETTSERQVATFAWFPDRTLQALWQPSLSLRPRSWTRSQVLSLCQRTGQPPFDALCATSLQRQRRTSSHKLSTHLPTSHSTRRNQPRTAAPARKALKHHHALTQSKRRFPAPRRLYRQYDVFIPTSPHKERWP